MVKFRVCRVAIAVVLGLMGAGTPSVAVAEIFPEIKSHPRLHADRQGFEMLKARLQTDELVRRVAERIRQNADRCLKSALPKHGLTDGKRMLSTSRRVVLQVSTLALAYRLFGDARHLRKAEAIMSAAVAMPDWNPRHFLDVAEMAYGVALGYDWLYDDLAPELRERIAQGLEKNALDPGIARRLDQGAFSNWSQVCPSGVSAAALAIYESVPEKARGYLSSVIDNFKLVMQMYRPHGSYPEGVGYWAFGTGFNVILIANLESAFGTSFGLADQPCFRETGYYPELMTGPSGLCFNYSDCSAIRSPSWVSWWFAQRYGMPEIVEPFVRKAFDRLLSDSTGELFLPTVIFYLFPRPADLTYRLPLAWRADGRLDLAVLRTSWESDAQFAAFKGGKAVAPHGHMDGGSFVYDAKGVRWAWDLGPDGYATVEHHVGEALWRYREGSVRFTIFRLSAAAHNVLTLDGLPHCATGDVRVQTISESPVLEAVLDLSPLYTNATKVIRRGSLSSKGFRIEDSVEGLRSGAPIKWQMMTKAQVWTDGDTLVLSQDGRKLEIRRQVPSTASAWQVDEAPHGAEWEKKNEEFRRISFSVPAASGPTSFAVEFQ